MSSSNDLVNKIITGDYKYGFSTDIDQDIFDQGLSAQTIKAISVIRQEPEWIQKFRMQAYQHLQTLTMPTWSNLALPDLDLQSFSYYASLKNYRAPKTLQDLDPGIQEMLQKLNIPLEEQNFLNGIATDIVIDSQSIFTTFKDKLQEYGVILCPISEAIQRYPELVKKYLGTVVSPYDNYFATLNAAVFSDGSFVYVPPGVKCPISISTYFRMNSLMTGQFERTLIIADKNSSVEYLEGCTAPAYSAVQMHAAVVELIAEEGATIHYSTMQNWYAGDAQGQGGVLNFVTKRGLAHRKARIAWTQIENGSLMTWKYPSVILKGDDSIGEYHAVAITKNQQQADTGTKMRHIGKNTKSIINVKSIAAGSSRNTYRGLVHIYSGATHAHNVSKCDSLIMGTHAQATTVPYINSQEPNSSLSHEATTARISRQKIYYLYQRGMSEHEAYSIIVIGFCKHIFARLPLEFAAEAEQLIYVTLENTIG